ncbi:hypothetical protein LJB89_02525 [Tyzzerella sp. OttesenSCG-928-J15]|nr:hypothetical protein [Tyzzerella sp. OttesenSCG-928-J15]
MNTVRFKNIIICVLVLLAVYQTSSLWFEDSAGNNIFSLASKVKEETPESGLKQQFAYPYRIVSGNGGGEFAISYGGMVENGMRVLCDKIIGDALKENEPVTPVEIEWQPILENPVIIYEYAFQMPVAEYLQARSIKSATIGAYINKFDSIAVSVLESGDININFINSETAECALVKFYQREYSQELLAVVSSAQVLSENEICYNSSILLGMESSENFFIPVWEAGGYYYNLGYARPVYYDENIGVEKSTIRANLISFFDNPTAVYDATSETAIASSDENTIVKYYGNDIVEYTSYKVTNKDTDLLDDYAVAIDFISKRDVLLENEFYLSSFEENDGERYFHFSYILNGLPVMLKEELKTSIKDYTQSGITVVFRQGNLVGYSRLAYGFDVSESFENASLNLPLYITSSGMDLNNFSSITLGYTADKIDVVAGTNEMNLFIEYMTKEGKAQLSTLN